MYYTYDHTVQSMALMDVGRKDSDEEKNYTDYV